jgi:formylglycine-generating enzyme required for sulfatase activity
MKTTKSLGLVLLTLCCATSAQSAVMFDWAIVGNPGNAPYSTSTGIGAVDYVYRISKHEVTNAQFAEFLNAVAATDTHGLYSISMGFTTVGGITRSGDPGSYTYSVKPDAVGQGPNGSDYTYATKPVVDVSFLQAMRFVNWLENGQPTGVQDASTTEDGVYAITDGLREMRNPNATFFIPSEDEWFKAAYHKNDGVTGNYWRYPTSHDTVDNHLLSADTGSSANYKAGDLFTTGNPSYPLTDVGAYTLSTSPYGTFDQAGNVYEYTEGLAFGIDLQRTSRGGSWYHQPHFMQASYEPFGRGPESGLITWGFRVASKYVPIPEPRTILLGTIAMMGMFMRPPRFRTCV